MDDLSQWLIASKIPGFGTQSLLQFLEKGISVSDLISASSSELKHWKFSNSAIQFLHDEPQQFIQQDLEWMGENKAIIPLCSEQYPVLLKEINDPPLILYVQGQIDLIKRSQLGIVGSRNPTNAGKNNAKEFAAALSQSGLMVTSGMALGIDGAAHEGALSVAEPTIAVMGTGLDRIYPAHHKDLAHKICENGALVSEFSIGTGVRPGNFPKRNRIISGLSLGVLVVEAALKSGSLITAKLAMDQGREVFAIPGSIHNPLARGCHSLIRDGAKLVEKANDILEELSALAIISEQDFKHKDKVPKDPSSKNKTETSVTLDQEQQAVFDAVDFNVTFVDEIVKQTQLPVAVVSGTLLLLELEGYIVNEKGGYSKSHPVN